MLPIFSAKRIQTKYSEVSFIQEMHMGGCWGELSSMKEMLKQHGFKYVTDIVASSNKVINGGTAIGTSSFLDHKKIIPDCINSNISSTSFCRGKLAFP